MIFQLVTMKVSAVQALDAANDMSGNSNFRIQQVWENVCLEDNQIDVRMQTKSGMRKA